MKFLVRSTALLFVLFAFASAEAKVNKYELNQLNANSFVFYPGLDFVGAKAAVLTTSTTPSSPEVALTYLEISFPKAAKLKASDFKLVGDKYRAVVNNAWIYREVIVEVDAAPFQFGFRPQMPIRIQAFISDRTAFIDPPAEIRGQPLFSVDGILRDVTPTRVVDTENLMIVDKKVVLSLKDRLGVSDANGFRTDGFMVDVLWYGKGAKTVYVHAPFPPSEFDNLEPIDLILTTVFGTEVLVSVKFKDPRGNDMIGPQVPLKELLNQAYGPSL